jgi:acyl-CoA thioester hydrolase
VVEHELPKLGVEGSIPFTRSSSSSFSSRHMIKDISAIDLTDRSSFICWTPVSIRFSDQDSLGHVNNVAVAAFVEAGRTGLIHPLLMRDKYPNLNFALVNVEIDYLVEFHYPGTIDIGGRLERIGSKSFSSKYGLFMENRCVATAGSVNVFFDLEKRKSVAPPDDVRALFEKTLKTQPS